MGMDSASGAGVRTHLRRGSNENTIHPLSVDMVESAPGPAPEAGRRLDQFRPFGRWFPWLVPSFIVANISMFIITMFLNNCPKNTSTGCIARVLGRLSFQPLKENPLFGPSSLTLQKMGALDVEKIVERHQGWRLITCIWLHAGVIHLLANMLSLVFIGIRLEQEFGFMRIGVLYVLSGFGGSLLSALFIQTSISVGASGALFGLLGGMLSELITNWTIYANKLAALLTLVFIIVVNLAMGILPHVDNFSHIGGFISGFLLGFVFLIRPQFGWISRKYRPAGYDLAPAKSKHKPYQYILWALALIVLIAWYTVGLIMLLRGVNANDHCSWCHYLSCVPTSRWGCKSESISCLTSQLGNQVNLTCPSNGQSHSYLLPDASSDDSIKQLCTQVCS